MKISGVNFYTPHSIQSNQQKHTIQSNINNFNLSSQAEIIGRSQVKFTGKEFEFWEGDRAFLDVLALNLRLNDEEKQKLDNVVKDYMIQNNFKYIDDMVIGDDAIDANEQAYFAAKISEALDLSDDDFDIVASELIDRIYCDGEYIPEDNRYQKDLPVLRKITENNNLDMHKLMNVFEILKQEAEENNSKSIFDNFREKPNPMLLHKIMQELDEDEYVDVAIELSQIGKLDDRTRQAKVEKHKAENEFYRNSIDAMITAGICETFNLDDKNFEELFEQVKRRRNNDISLMQVAYEISEKYSLPPKAESKIIEIIKDCDDIGDKLYKD